MAAKKLGKGWSDGEPSGADMAALAFAYTLLAASAVPPNADFVAALDYRATRSMLAAMGDNFAVPARTDDDLYVARSFMEGAARSPAQLVYYPRLIDCFIARCRAHSMGALSDVEHERTRLLFIAGSRSL